MKSNDSDNSKGKAPDSVPVVSRLRRVIDVSDMKDVGTKSAGGKHKSHAPKKQEPRNAAPKDQPQKKRVKAVSAPQKQAPAAEAAAPAQPQVKPQQPKKQLFRAKPKNTEPQRPQPPKSEENPVEKKRPAEVKKAETPNLRASASTHLKVARSLRTTGKHTGLRLAEKHLRTTRERLKTPKFLARKLKADPVPARAIQVDDRINEALLLQSWHAKKWISSITAVSSGIADMLLKSMPLVQARFVNNLNITCGRIEATVVDQITTIAVRQFTPGQWRVLINMLSDRAIYTTSLLNGELPEGIQDVFKQASLSLFPGKYKELSFECDCGAEMPCEHACALLLAFAVECESDPSLLLTLRGMHRDELLSQLRDARSDQVVDDRTKNHYTYELPAQNVDYANFYTANGNLREMSFHIEATPNTLIKRLGTPSQWKATAPFDAVIMPVIEAASQEAEKLSLMEPAENAEPEDAAVQRPMSRAPKNSSKTPRFVMPDLSFVTRALTPEILETITDDPVTTAEDIIRWLKTRGASDIRTLARRTRLHKPTIEAFLNAFCDAGLTVAEGEEEKRRFSVTF